MRTLLTSKAGPQVCPPRGKESWTVFKPKHRHPEPAAGGEPARAGQPVIPLDISQSEALAEVMARALCDEPHFTYLMPELQVRQSVLPWFFRALIQASLAGGETHTTPSIEAGVLWLAPGRDVTIQSVVRTELHSARSKPQWSHFRPGIALGVRMRQVRRRLVPTPHWYLMSLSAEPSVERHAILKALLEPVLSRADSQRVPCYLETFHESDLHFYEETGFRIEGGGCVPRGGPNFWAMVRRSG
jgi:hypothetical protein